MKNMTGKHMHMSKSYFGVAPKASCTLPKIEIDKTLFWNLCNLSERKMNWSCKVSHTALAAHHSQLIVETFSSQLKGKISCCKMSHRYKLVKLKNNSPLSLREWGHWAEKVGIVSQKRFALNGSFLNQVDQCVKAPERSQWNVVYYHEQY